MSAGCSSWTFSALLLFLVSHGAHGNSRRRCGGRPAVALSIPRPLTSWCARASSKIAAEYAVPLAGEGKAGAALEVLDTTAAAVDKQTMNERSIAAASNAAGLVYAPT